MPKQSDNYSPDRNWMILDIIFFGALIWGFSIGYRKGLIHSLIFLLAFGIGIIVALKSSFLLAVHLDNWFNIDSQYLPFVSFILTFLLVVGLIILIGKLIEGIVKAVQLNFLNKMAGALIWTLIFMFILSTLFWYLERYEVISDSMIEASKTYGMVSSISPLTVGLAGKIFPFLSELYESISGLITKWSDPQINNLPTN